MSLLDTPVDSYERYREIVGESTGVKKAIEIIQDATKEPDEDT